MKLRIDHVLYGARDLEAAARRWADEFGLASYPGGRHTGRGTANRIVPLGRDYIELIGVVDPVEAGAAPTSRWLEEQVATGDRFVGWCVTTDDLDADAARLGLQPSDWSRTRPDGVTLRWRLAGREEAAAQPSRPFFIAWEVPDDQHPSRMAITHRVAPLGIAWVEVAGARADLDRWLGGAPLPVRVVEGPPGVRAVGIRTVDGEIVVRT